MIVVTDFTGLQLPLDVDVPEIDPAETMNDHDSTAPTEEELIQLRKDILTHVEGLNLPSWANGQSPAQLSKDAIRVMHADQRNQVLDRERVSLKRKWTGLIEHFANGWDVRPDCIDPELVLVKSDDWTGDLFRLAALLWSVPVSKGYGRRMRYLVRDRSNGKLIGIFALADPVFNLRTRDKWIGWDVEQRRSGLVNVMDANVVGSVQPYSSLLGGKLVASLIGSAEVSADFSRRYSETQGIISKRIKSARLVLVTISSALGRSSIYNRLKLPDNTRPPGDDRTLVELARLGSTEGYGHFQLSDKLFNRLRDIAARSGHAYANGHQFGQGPNWRFRLSRVGLAMVGVDTGILRHGIAREVYAMPMAADCREFLRGEIDEIRLDRPTVKVIAEAAKTRWILPRAIRTPEFETFDRRQLAEEIRRMMDAESTS